MHQLLRWVLPHSGRSKVQNLGAGAGAWRPLTGVGELPAARCKVASALKAALDAAAMAKQGPIILMSAASVPWTSSAFKSAWSKAAKKAGITGLNFHDLRGTFVTRAALAGSTEAEIAAITGHSLKDVRSILDANYLSRDPQLGENAIQKLEKLETRTKLQTELQTGAVRTIVEQEKKL